MENVLQLNNYEEYLRNREKELTDIEMAKINDESNYIVKIEKEKMTELYLAQGLTDKQIDLDNFNFYLLNNQEYQLVVIRENEYYRFMNSDIEDYIMNIKLVDYEDFYEKAFGIDLWEFEKNFVSISFMDENQDMINIILKVNGVNERFVIHVS